MNFKANYEGVSLTSTSPYTYAPGVPMSASTIHQVFCLTSGTINVTPLGGGGPFAWAATAGQSMDIVLGAATVSSGTFVGFKSKFFPTQGVSSQFTF